MNEPAYTLDDPAVDIAVEQLLSEYRKARDWRDGEGSSHTDITSWLDGAQAATVFMETIAARDSRTVEAVDRFWKRVGLGMVARERGSSEAVVDAEITHWASLPEADRRRQDLETLHRYAADTQDPEVFALIQRLEAELSDLDGKEDEPTSNPSHPRGGRVNMSDVVNTPRPLREWSYEELAHLEELLNEALGKGGTDWYRTSHVGAPNLADWYDYHLETIDRLLHEAGVPPATGSVRPYRHLELRVIDGEVS